MFFFLYSRYYSFWDKNMAPIWKYCLARLYLINLSIHMYIETRRITREYRSKDKIDIFMRASRLSRSASIRVHVGVRNG